MHELSVAESIVTIIKENTDGGDAKVSAVRVRIGELAGVIPESLEFCFSAITAGTSLEGSRLEIERTAIVCHCEACGTDSTVNGLVFRCPRCHGPHITITSGNELQVVEIEIDD